MGYVYEGIHETIERRVAIKLLKSEFAKSPEALTRFFNEARIVNRIEHESLVEVSDHGQTPDGAVFLVMEYVRGETLRTRLNRLEPTGQRIAMEQTVIIIRQVAEALAAAHDKGVVHRDTSIKTKICLRKGDIAIHRRRTDHAYLPFTH